MKEEISNNQFGSKATNERLRKTLRAAFNMKPTPLKAIPKKHGKAQPPRASRKAKQSI